MQVTLHSAGYIIANQQLKVAVMNELEVSAMRRDKR